MLICTDKKEIIKHWASLLTAASNFLENVTDVFGDDMLVNPETGKEYQDIEELKQAIYYSREYLRTYKLFEEGKK
jgi:hypothetical protein